MRVNHVDGHLADSGESRVGAVGRVLERDLEPERGAGPHFALDADLPVHGFDELLGDRESEARAAVLARGRRVDLREALEQPVDAVFGDADARVAHLDAQPDATSLTRGGHDVHADLATLGELDRVVHEVGDRLPDSGGIALQPVREPVIDADRKLEALLVGIRCKDLTHIAHAVTQAEPYMLELEPPRLDLREVQDVVDDREQCVTGRVDGADAVGLLRVEIGVGEQLGHPEHHVHRSADLVAHHRKKVALGAGCGLGGRAGFSIARGEQLERLVLHLEASDVIERRDRPRDLPVDVDDRCAVHHYSQVRLVLGAEHERRLGVAALLLHRAVPGEGRSLLGRQLPRELRCLPSDQTVHLDADLVRERLVRQDDAALAVQNEHAFREDVQGRANSRRNHCRRIEVAQRPPHEEQVREEAGQRYEAHQLEHRTGPEGSQLTG